MARFDLKHHKLIDCAKALLEWMVPRRVLSTLGFRLFRSWLFQGALYMEWRELIFRIAIELLLTVIVYFSFYEFPAPVWLLVASLLLAHTAMWVFNGHIWALSIGQNRRLARNKPEEILSYLDGLYDRVNNVSSIESCIIFGSLSRGEFTEHSDLDILCCRKKGLLNSLVAFSLGMRERMIAFMRCMPVELYFYDMTVFRGLDEKERPILLKERNKDITSAIKGCIPYRQYPFSEQSFFHLDIGEHDSG